MTDDEIKRSIERLEALLRKLKGFKTSIDEAIPVVEQDEAVVDRMVANVVDSRVTRRDLRLASLGFDDVTDDQRRQNIGADDMLRVRSKCQSS